MACKERKMFLAFIESQLLKNNEFCALPPDEQKTYLEGLDSEGEARIFAIQLLEELGIIQTDWNFKNGGVAWLINPNTSPKRAEWIAKARCKLGIIDIWNKEKLFHNEK